MHRILTVLLLLVMQGATAQYQNIEEVKKQYSGKEIVFYNYNQQLDLYLKDDVPVATSNHEVEMLMLSEKNASLYSRYNIYHSSFNELKDMDAYTLVPSGDKYKKVKIVGSKTTNSSSNSVFYDDSKETSFDFPSLTQNAIAHVNYEQFHKDAHLLTPFYYPSGTTVVNATYTVVVPENISIHYVVKNDKQGLFKLEVEKKKKETIYKWTARNLKEDEDFYDAPGDAYYRPHIIVYITSYESKDGHRNFLSNLDDLYKWNSSFLKELNTGEDPLLKKEVDSIVKNKTSDIDKAKSIYKWVQQNIKYVAFEDGLEGFRPRQAADVCRKRYGDCKDMSSIITAMLRQAGLKAYYTWIGTRSIPYDYSEIPLPIVDNHMISTLNINDKWIFLDGTDPNARFAVPPSSIQGKEALVSINEKEYKVIRVPVIDAPSNVIVDSTTIKFTDAGISGNENVTYYGYFGDDVYNSLLYKDENTTKDYVKRKMGKASNKFILGDYTIQRVDTENGIANISAGFDIPGYSRKVGDEYYINLNLEKLLEKNIIDTTKRVIPMEMEYKYLIKQYHILEIPAGYKVTYKPKDFKIENDLVSVNMYYEIKNEKVTAAQEVKLKQIMINPHDFSEWNKLMKEVQLQYKESVVLSKK